MRFSSRTPYEVWSALGPRIAARANAVVVAGDWVIFGERRYGHRYRLAIEATGLDYQTLRNYAVVARRFDLSRRRDNLSFQHHAEVCALSDDEQDRWLDLAVEYRWSKQELRLRIRRRMRIAGRRQAVRVVRFSVDDEHEERWREAAARSQCSFEEWVVSSLDAAAIGESPAGEPHQAGGSGTERRVAH